MYSERRRAGFYGDRKVYLPAVSAQRFPQPQYSIATGQMAAQLRWLVADQHPLVGVLVGEYPGALGVLLRLLTPQDTHRVVLFSVAGAGGTLPMEALQPIPARETMVVDLTVTPGWTTNPRAEAEEVLLGVYSAHVRVHPWLLRTELSFFR